MHQHLSKPLASLLVVSDTAMVISDQRDYGFGPVVKELQAFDFVDQIIWIGFQKEFKSSYYPIEDERIRLIGLPNTGGRTILAKLKILYNYPVYFYTILKSLLKVDYIHARAPSNPAIIVYFLSWFFPKKQFWFKYAGSWNGKASKFYMVQRFLLKYASKNVKVTVNGLWDNQKTHIIPFENPCLTTHDRNLGKKIVDRKKEFNKPTLCFVGNLDDNKGVKILINTLKDISRNSIEKVHIVGGGKLEEWIVKQANTIPLDIIIHGTLPKDAIIDIYKISNVLVLPSKSEGFPKVIGEAMNFGCIPIVSNISCIDQYIKDGVNGFLLENRSIVSLKNAILKIPQLNYKQVIYANYCQAAIFEYNYYNQRIMRFVFN